MRKNSTTAQFELRLFMEIGSKEWSHLIINGADRFNIDLNHHHTDQYAIHARELTQWTEKINITSITDPFEIAVKHFLDSLAPAPLILPGMNLLDIGSGGGFPGLPLKVLIPSMSVTLIDASRKKVSFLKHVIRTLTLNHIHALHSRAEDLTCEKGFDVIISRALTSLEFFVRRAEPLLARQGLIIALKGEVDQQELNDLQSNRVDKTGRSNSVPKLLSISIKKYKLPYLHSKRSIVLIRKID